MTTRTPEELEEKLHYHFKNKELLITALTHSSYANESKTPTLYNERLEFLGDSVLSVVVANYLFHHSTRPEGELSRMRASLVSEDALFQFAQEIDLGSYLRLGRGEELGGGRCRPSVVSDAFEATIAALFLDGGIETARNFILPFITEGKTAEDDHKTALQEVVQKHPDDRLTYTVTGESGLAHDKRFQVTVALNGKALAERLRQKQHFGFHPVGSGRNQLQTAARCGQDGGRYFWRHPDPRRNGLCGGIADH